MAINLYGTKIDLVIKRYGQKDEYKFDKNNKLVEELLETHEFKDLSVREALKKIVEMYD